MTAPPSLASLQTLWDDHARADPLWAVLSFDDKRNRAWDLREFMKRGELEIALVIHRCGQLGLDLSYETALDFGCGVGRLTQALARRFDRVVGVDISPEMIRLANALNRYPGRAEYAQIGIDGLRRFSAGEFAFVYSSMVLQHLPPDLALGYLDEFLHVLRPDVLLVFQLPSHRLEPASTEIRSMPDAAYRARVEMGHQVPARLVGGERTQIGVRVTNLSDHVWMQREIGSVQVGNHWFDATGELMVTQDDGRAVIPQTVAPTDSFDVDLTITPPRTAGRYWLEIDVVHEGVSWFAGKGSRPVRIPIDVVTSSSDVPATPQVDERPIPHYDQRELSLTPAADGVGEPEVFAMHGIAKEIVVPRLERAGGEVVKIEDDPRAGHEWQSYRYCVRRR